MNAEKPNYTEVADYYNKTWADLDSKNLSRINDRHRFLMKYLLNSGLKRNHKVLEIGCGIATVTYMLAKWLTKGEILGVDISPETIDLVKHRFSHQKNLRFRVSDMTDFTSDEKFDCILFPDVLEHIPMEAHENIFRTVSGLVKEDGKIFINVPEPVAMEYIQVHRPELLQIIDQALHAHHIVSLAYKYGFILEYTERYSVYFNEPEYQFYCFRKRYSLQSIKDKSKYAVMKERIKVSAGNFFKSWFS